MIYTDWNIFDRGMYNLNILVFVFSFSLFNCFHKEVENTLVPGHYHIVQENSYDIIFTINDDYSIDRLYPSEFNFKKGKIIFNEDKILLPMPRKLYEIDTFEYVEIESGVFNLSNGRQNYTLNKIPNSYSHQEKDKFGKHIDLELPVENSSLILEDEIENKFTLYVGLNAYGRTEIMHESTNDYSTNRSGRYVTALTKNNIYLDGFQKYLVRPLVFFDKRIPKYDQDLVLSGLYNLGFDSLYVCSSIEKYKLKDSLVIGCAKKSIGDILEKPIYRRNEFYQDERCTQKSLLISKRLEDISYSDIKEFLKTIHHDCLDDSRKVKFQLEFLYRVSSILPTKVIMAILSDDNLDFGAIMELFKLFPGKLTESELAELHKGLLKIEIDDPELITLRDRILVITDYDLN